MNTRPAPAMRLKLADVMEQMEAIGRRLDDVERRLRVMEANIDLCVVYVREIAKERMTETRIAEIDRRLR